MTSLSLILKNVFKTETKILRLSLFLLLLIPVASACSPVGLTSSSPGAVTTGGGGNDGDGEEAGSGSGSSSGAEDAEAMPQASIPAPTLKKTMVAAADSEGYVPVVGYEGAIDTSDMTDADSDGTMDDVYVVASTTDLSATTTSGHWVRSNSYYASLQTRQENSCQSDFQLIKSAYATSFSASAPETTPVCSSTGLTTDASGNQYTCCPINTDGSFECFHPATNSDTLYVAVASGADLGDPVSDTVNSNFLYVRQNPTDVKPGTTGLGLTHLGITDAGIMFNLAGDSVVPIVHKDDGTFMVTGDHTANYESGTVTGGAQVAFDPTSLTFSGRVAGTGIPYSTFNASYVGDPLNDMLDSWTESTTEEAESYTVLKKTGALSTSQTRFAIKSAEGMKDRGRIYSLENPDLDTNRITFIDPTLDTLTHNQTLAFDVDDSMGIAVALFEDTDGFLRLRGTYSSTTMYPRFDGNSPLSGSYTFSGSDFIELMVYYPQPGVSTPGKALLLDKTHSTAWVIDYRYSPTAEGTVTSSLTTGTNSITIGDNTVSVSLNADKTKAFALSQDEKKIYVLDLFESDGTTVREAPSVTTSTINLADYMGDKEVTYTPNSLTYQKATDGTEYLLVGLQEAKADLVVNFTTATLATP